tara:strand:- start:62 stop:235 length:174 start_codon:yes stop_codon:yes gene_type:complete
MINNLVKSLVSDIVSGLADAHVDSTELLDNNTFTNNANARQYLVSSKGWIITDGGAA